MMSQSHRAEDATQNLLGLNLVEDLSDTNALRLDTGNSKIFLFLGEPPCCLRPVGEGDESNE